MVIAAGAIVVSASAGQPASAGTYTLIPAYAEPGTETGVLGINDAGYMTGNVVNADGSGSGFLRSPGGTYTLFSDGDRATIGRAINASNQITGYSYVDATNDIRTADEFRREADGTITLLHNPVTGDALHGIAQGINAAGVIVGENFTQSGTMNFRHGYILDGASYTELSLSPDFRVKTVARGINDAGLVVGWTLDNNDGVTRGFVYSSGAYQQFVTDPSAANAATTYLEAVNNHGLASGEWLDALGDPHAFLYDTLSHAFTELAAPGGGAYDAFGLNDRGEVVLTSAAGINYLYDPTGVPEPAAWSLMIMGLGCVGYALRRRQGAASTTSGAIVATGRFRRRLSTNRLMTAVVAAAAFEAVSAAVPAGAAGYDFTLSAFASPFPDEVDPYIMGSGTFTISGATGTFTIGNGLTSFAASGVAFQNGLFGGPFAISASDLLSFSVTLAHGEVEAISLATDSFAVPSSFGGSTPILATDHASFSVSGVTGQNLEATVVESMFPPFAGTFTLTTIPEPASWLLMIMGFGLVGTAMRRPLGQRE
ncbi:PEPxxWA-CTERM sorting domain-containing protein [Sphingomonas bacterium]|uniref:PEPxxWA-CTERM sorting domain-containing protein n=1 Tax=Sphingomonas bacterium TaxID=1895847 RepID=UPI0015764538|nr:PEPxxWA-CTERM sorting domain-containing protein [Sphingomonas bacterium]